MEPWSKGGLSVDCAIGGGVLTLDLIGLCTPWVMNAFCRSGGELDPGVYCLLAMFDRAMVAMTAEDFTALLKIPQVQHGDLRTPGAIVCRKTDYALFRRHSRQCAEAGFVRKVFTSDQTELAVAWTAERASAARLAALSRLGHPSPFRAPAA